MKQNESGVAGVSCNRQEENNNRHSGKIRKKNFKVINASTTGFQ